MADQVDHWGHLLWAELGGQRLQVGEIRAVQGRDLVAFRYPGRDGSEQRDTGAKGGKWSVEAHFTDDGTTSYLDAFRAVRDVMNGAAVVTWQPPHDSEYQVRVEQIDSVTNADGARYVHATLELVEDTDATASFLADDRGEDALVQDFDLAVKEVEDAVEALQAAQAAGLL